MSRETNIIRGGGTYVEATSVFSTLPGSQSTTPAQTQRAIPLAENNNRSADQLEISAGGREAQARLDLGNLLERLIEKNSKLTPEQQKLIEKYKSANLEVRTEEQTHLAAADNWAVRGANIESVKGLDGARYAIVGEVQIEPLAVPNDPQAAWQITQDIRQTALAPAQPSLQDHRVSAQAEAMAARASTELLQRTASQLSPSSSKIPKNIYLAPTDSSQPMWVDVFA
jgi:hypothetical protein